MTEHVQVSGKCAHADEDQEEQDFLAPTSPPKKGSRKLARGESIHDDLEQSIAKSAMIAAGGKDFNTTEQHNTRVAFVVVDPFLVDTRRSVGSVLFGDEIVKALWKSMRRLQHCPWCLLLGRLHTWRACILTYNHTKYL